VFKYEKELELLKNNIPALYKKNVDSKRIKQYKDLDSIVTAVDINMEKDIIHLIHRTFKMDYILSEEGHSKNTLKDRTWIIDPIDGTTNFANEIADFVVQVAFYDLNELQFSYLYFPKENKAYYAKKDFGAYVDDKKIHTSDASFLPSEMISLTSLQESGKLNPNIIPIIERAIDKRMKLRIFGSIGVEFIYLASGKTVMMNSYTKNIWDIAPGLLLIKEAGALVLNLEGKPYNLYDCGMVVYANETIYRLFNE
jgi:myo-inositol-1(or 4)-monophosphatase